MELRIIKSDLLKELQNETYYNEQEIARLATKDTSLSHKKIVKKIARLAKENAKIMDAINLIDKMYFPNAPQPSADQQSPTAQQ